MRLFCLFALMVIVIGSAGADTPLPWSPQAAEQADTARMRAHAEAHLAQQPPDFEQALHWFESAAEAGSSRAMAWLGWMHEHGHGVEQDGTVAVEWYARAVEAGAVDYTLHLGWMHLRGELVTRDRALAEQWFRRGIAADHPPARVALASVLIADAQGGHHPERTVEAEALLREALDADSVIASYFLARLYGEGIGAVQRDAERAFHYTRIGAEDGNPQLQGWLGLRYARGDGIDADAILANKWASLAAANGDELGGQLRLELESAMPPEDVNESRRRAAQWARRYGR